jgi:hypothetical protein
MLMRGKNCILCTEEEEDAKEERTHPAVTKREE